MVVSVIGHGRVGTHLQKALRQAGHEVVWLSGRDFTPDEVRGEVVIIAVRDDAIADVSRHIGNTTALVAHTSGSKPLSTIEQKRRGVFYPMQTFSKEREVEFKEIPLFLESYTDMHLLRQLAESISNNVRELDSENRRKLHLAAVFACNFTNHCYALASQITEEAGVDFSALLPLIDETAQKVHEMSPIEAQTGPAVRMDMSVIERHESMLSGKAKDIYHLISESIYDTVRSKDN